MPGWLRRQERDPRAPGDAGAEPQQVHQPGQGRGNSGRLTLLVAAASCHLNPPKPGDLRIWSRLPGSQLGACVDGERFDGAEFVVDFREGGAAVMWLALAGHRGLHAPVFKMGQQGLAA